MAYKKICKGIKYMNGKYIVTLSVTPRKYENLNVHLGSFDDLQKAKEILSEGEKIKDGFSGDDLINELDKLKAMNQKQKTRKEIKTMSTERNIVEALDGVLMYIRKAEQDIIGMDSADKLEVVKQLVNLEDSVKKIKSEITIPAIEITKDTLIAVLGEEKVLSVRAVNVLSRAGCKTVEDITNHTAHEISVMRNMGRKSADEVIDFLKANGFSLKQLSKHDEIYQRYLSGETDIKKLGDEYGVTRERIRQVIEKKSKENEEDKQ